MSATSGDEDGQIAKGARAENHTTLSVVIVTYNCLSELQGCLRSVPAGAGSVSYEVIIVDNSSFDGTLEWVKRNSVETRVISNSSNLGFARACNQAIQTARGQYILILNPDTIVAKGTIQRTHEYMERAAKVAAATCKVMLPNGKIDPSCKRDFPSPWDAFCRMIGLSRLFPRSRIFARYDTGYSDENQQQEVPLIDGCYMMIRRTALEDIGLFDERFYMYAEEMDWCRRAHLRGWSIGYDPSCSIVHFKGAITRRSTFRMLYHFHRSMALYYRKHFSPWNPVRFLIYPGILFRLVVLMLLNLVRADRRVSGQSWVKTERAEHPDH